MSPRRLGAWRLGLCRWLERAAAAIGGRRYYRRMHLGADVHQRRERVELRELPDDLVGFRIAHLSDLHAGPFLGAGDLAAVVEVVNAGRPDLVVLTGDFITHHWSEALEILPDLAGLATRHGCLAVFGNHDYRDRAEGRIAAAYRERGIRILRNESERLRVGAAVLAVVGLEDLEEARAVDLASALSEVEPGDVPIFLCHNPAGGAELSRGRSTLVLSGHTHGHQINLPIARGMGPPHPGDRVELDASTLIVSRGLGVVCVPLRVAAPAEVVWIELARPEERRRAG